MQAQYGAAVQPPLHLGRFGLPGAPPLRGATASRTQALATFHGLVAGSNEASASVEPNTVKATAHLPPPQPSAAVQAPASAPTARAADMAAPSKQDGGADVAAAPLLQHDTQPHGCPGTVPALPLSPRRAAQRLPHHFEALQRCAQQITQRNASYLYQHHDDLSAAKQHLQSCMACLPAVLANGAAVVPSLLFQGSTCCWVSTLSLCLVPCMPAAMHTDACRRL